MLCVCAETHFYNCYCYCYRYRGCHTIQHRSSSHAGNRHRHSHTLHFVFRLVTFKNNLIFLSFWIFIVYSLKRTINSNHFWCIVIFWLAEWNSQLNKFERNLNAYWMIVSFLALLNFSSSIQNRRWKSTKRGDMWVCFMLIHSMILLGMCSRFCDFNKLWYWLLSCIKSNDKSQWNPNPSLM